MAKPREEIEAEVAQRIREGFDGFEEIVEGVVEYLAEIILPPIVCPCFASLQRRPGAGSKEQTSWTVNTNGDRLDRAYATLERSAMVSRQTFPSVRPAGMRACGNWR